MWLVRNGFRKRFAGDDNNNNYYYCVYMHNTHKRFSDLVKFPSLTA